MVLTLEEFVYRCEWQEVIRLSRYIGDWDLRKIVLKKIREFKRGREMFQGPHGDRSAWAGMVRGWYGQYLAEIGTAAAQPAEPGEAQAA